LEHVDIVKELVEAGAKVDIQDEEGSTPFDVAEGETKKYLSQ
jgi:ankyrin repeat protein